LSASQCCSQVSPRPSSRAGRCSDARVVTPAPLTAPPPPESARFSARNSGSCSKGQVASPTCGEEPEAAAVSSLSGTQLNSATGRLTAGLRRRARTDQARKTHVQTHLSHFRDDRELVAIVSAGPRGGRLLRRACGVQALAAAVPLTGPLGVILPSHQHAVTQLERRSRPGLGAGRVVPQDTD